MSAEEVVQQMAREWIANHPGASVEEVAGWISACGCVGCPQWKSPNFYCECGAKCRCRCTLEPFKSQNAAHREWAFCQARAAHNTSGQEMESAYTEEKPTISVQCPACQWNGLPSQMSRYMRPVSGDLGERFCPRCGIQIRDAHNTGATSG